jgi:ribosome-associated toxin RatA of RatAB toxin-antitoxin module
MDDHCGTRNGRAGWQAVWRAGCILLGGAAVLAGEIPAAVLDIHDDPAGGKRAVATVHIEAPPEAVRAVLNDFARWPELFGGRFQLVKLERQPDRVVTDLRIRSTPLPGTLQLVCETRNLPNGDIVTSLIEGDFRRYRRRWRLIPEANGPAVHTRAEMELSVDPATWVPGWLFAAMLRRDLMAHFASLRERAVAQTAGR